MKKSVLFLITAVLFVAACQESEEMTPVVSDDVLSAQIEQDEMTKTILDENNNVLWSSGDQIVVFKKAPSRLQYQLNNEYIGKTYGEFSKTAGGEPEEAVWSHIVAYYPYSEVIVCEESDDDYVLNVVLPSEQTYVSESFGNGAFPMVAVSEDTDITFKNVCGGMKLQLKGTATVKSITVVGKNNQKLSGSATVTASTDDTKPAITMTSTEESAKSVTLNCGEGVQLNESTATEFIIALPPVKFTNGFSVTVTNIEGGTQIIETEKENEVLRSSLLKMPELTLGSDFEPAGPVNLSSSGTANSYIVSELGEYKFRTVKGNGSESVGDIAVAKVLWESFGTSTNPSEGDLVKNVSYADGYITFEATDKKGNAVIAAKDASGKILWSWHIWLTDKPAEHVYNNNAGTMMDRNLGATSTTPGDVGALGLLYQWGRKDPFLASSSISSNTFAKSTITWPSAVNSDSSTGTIDYVTANPTTFLIYNGNNSDWYYSDVKYETDDTRWQSEKTIYDPCPAGWRVPDGGSSGVWSTAGFANTPFDIDQKGISFSISSPSTTWYPASGYCSSNVGVLYSVGLYGNYWSVTPNGYNAYYLNFSYYGSVNPSDGSYRAYGYAVRCFKEGTGGGLPFNAKDLSISATANSYIVSEPGSYMFRSTKGNSTTSVGTVASADVLWETFGTDVTPNVGDLINNVTYDDGYIAFDATDKKGNAVIAAKDADGKILWSWHIWLTDQPQAQVYNNNAGTMMDRNLGATSATPGDVGAYGLLYQWGRKDPFLGSSSIDLDEQTPFVASTINWPSAVRSDSETGTIDYVTGNPTTFLIYNSNNIDWYYSGSSSTDETRWQSEKTIYDPCPPGWRVPDGGSSGVWAKAGFANTTFDIYQKGISFSISSPSTTWYPASGYILSYDGCLTSDRVRGNYWSVTNSGDSASCLYFHRSGTVNPSDGSNRANGFAVRCLQVTD